MKPRVMSLVIFTCVVGLIIAPTQVGFFDASLSIMAVALGAGAAGALNMWYEADLDKLMTRTCLRPIPTGKVNREHALVFGILLSVISILGLYYFANILSAILLSPTQLSWSASGILFLLEGVSIIPGSRALHVTPFPFSKAIIFVSMCTAALLVQ